MAAAGLYEPRLEHDACRVGFVADLSGRGGHDVVARALRVLCNLEHRGAKGGDPGTGDGAGILTQIPDEFFRATCDFELPEAGAYAAGMAFFSAERHLVTPALARLAAAEGLVILGWREVPFDLTACGDGARAVLPDVLQLFVAGAEGQRGMELERMAFCLRKRAEHEAGVYFASLSCRTIVYKGMLSAVQLGPFYPDLSDPAYTPTRPRPGRCPPRPGTWPTTARSTRSGATATGCGPGRPCWPAISSRPRATARGSSACSRSSTTTPATRPASTSAWNCCTWAAARCRTRS